MRPTKLAALLSGVRNSGGSDRIGLDGAGDVEDIEPPVGARRDEEAVDEIHLALRATGERREHFPRLER